MAATGGDVVAAEAVLLELESVPGFESVLESLLESLLEPLPLLASEDLGLALPYPSAYQPPPLKLTAGAWRTRSRCPPQ